MFTTSVEYFAPGNSSLLSLILGLTILLSLNMYAQHSFEGDYDIPYGDNPETGKYTVVNGTRL
ncbi:MAG: hypothetical protein PHN68_07200 [Prolixibacteraceae bacterium]|jgi:hypothetical protein|nr:hypothetical protein [Prolixibacteraceae bacterium]MDD4754654.1 hypothetical protein [Prolixibacteraceae bacterium]NLO00829.1 hypothetical protein [Bacteroidales bacterium]